MRPRPDTRATAQTAIRLIDWLMLAYLLVAGCAAVTSVITR